MQTKKTFFKSKINWIAIALIIASIMSMIQDADFASIKGWITFGLGVVLIIVRTYFTSQPVTKAKKR